MKSIREPQADCDPATVMRPQDTVTKDHEDTTLTGRGRHDG